MLSPFKAEMGTKQTENCELLFSSQQISRQDNFFWLQPVPTNLSTNFEKDQVPLRRNRELRPGLDGGLWLAVPVRDGVVDALAACHEGGLLRLEVADRGQVVLGVAGLKNEAWKQKLA